MLFKSGSWIAALALMSACVATADTIIVPTQEPTIQGAIDSAAGGDTVLVLPGVYPELLNFLGKGIVVTGSAPFDSAIVAATVVDGEGMGRGVTFESGEDSTSVLMGLTVTGGEGGVLCFESSPMLIRCDIARNTSTNGAGVSVSGGSVTMIACRILENTSVGAPWQNGAGIHVSAGSALVRQCLVSRNLFTSLTTLYRDGGGISAANHSSLTIIESVISHNGGAGEGGGIYVSGAQLDVRDSVIEYNAAGSGGGVGVRHNAPYQATLERCVLRGNTAWIGGAISGLSPNSLALDHCLLIDNIADQHGGAIYTEERISSTIRNTIIARNTAQQGAGVWEYQLYQPETIEYDQCVFADNIASEDGGALYTDVFEAPRTISNSIVWGNQPNHFAGAIDLLTVRYSNIEQGWPGNGNIGLPPLFRTLGPFEYLLGPGSRSIDSGDPLVEDGLYDWHPRWPAWLPNGARSDMGAYGGPENWLWLTGP